MEHASLGDLINDLVSFNTEPEGCRLNALDREKKLAMMLPVDFLALIHSHQGTCRSYYSWLLNGDFRANKIRKDAAALFDRDPQKYLKETEVLCEKLLPDSVSSANGVVRDLLCVDFPKICFHFQSQDQSVLSAHLRYLYTQNPRRALAAGILYLLFRLIPSKSVTVADSNHFLFANRRMDLLFAITDQEPMVSSDCEEIQQQFHYAELLYEKGQHAKALQIYQEIADALPKEASAVDGNEFFPYINKDKENSVPHINKDKEISVPQNYAVDLNVVFYRIADMYAHGDGCARNERRACFYYEKAVRYGVLGLYELYEFYSYGRTCNRHPEKAAECLRTAAASRDYRAMRDLGLAFYEGNPELGIEKDLTKAEDFFTLGAAVEGEKQTDGTCHFMLGRLQALQGNYEDASVFYEIAARCGHPDARQELLRMHPDARQELPDEHTDMRQELPGGHTDSRQVCPGGHTDMSLELPDEYTDMRQELPDEHTDMRQELPGGHTDSRQVCPDGHPNTRHELPGGHTDMRLELPGGYRNALRHSKNDKIPTRNNIFSEVEAEKNYENSGKSDSSSPSDPSSPYAPSSSASSLCFFSGSEDLFSWIFPGTGEIYPIRPAIEDQGILSLLQAHVTPSIFDRRMVFYLFSDDPVQNLNDTLAVISFFSPYLSSSEAYAGKIMANTEIFVRCSDRISELMIDSAVASLEPNYLPVHIANEFLDAANQLLINAPCFFPVAAIYGGGDEAFWMVKTLIGTCSVGKEPLSIVVIDSQALALRKRLLEECPGIFSCGKLIRVKLFFVSEEEAIDNPAIASLLAGCRYFICASDRDTENITRAVRLRELTLRQDPLFENRAFIAACCRDSRINWQARHLSVGDQMPGFDWYNNFNIYFYGSLSQLYSVSSLQNNLSERLGWLIHRNYSEPIRNNEHLNSVKFSYYSCYYNHDVSRGGGIAFPYHLHALGITLPNWRDYGTSTGISLLKDRFDRWLADHSQTGDPQLELVSQREHERWNAFMLTRGWLPASITQMNTYMQLGTRKHHLSIARLHPYIASWEDLGDENHGIQQAVNRIKLRRNPDADLTDIKELDRNNIRMIGEFYGRLTEKHCL